MELAIWVGLRSHTMTCSFPERTGWTPDIGGGCGRGRERGGVWRSQGVATRVARRGTSRTFVCCRSRADSGGAGEKVEGVGVVGAHDSEVSVVERRNLGFVEAFSDGDQAGVDQVEVQVGVGGAEFFATVPVVCGEFDGFELPRSDETKKPLVRPVPSRSRISHADSAITGVDDAHSVVPSRSVISRWRVELWSAAISQMLVSTSTRLRRDRWTCEQRLVCAGPWCQWKPSLGRLNPRSQ